MVFLRKHQIGRHGRTGHLFQGRYKAILVDGESYLLELTRYVVLNPVRPGMVTSPGDLLWSSYRAMAGEAPASSWLATDSMLAQFPTHRNTATKRYREFVTQGMNQESIWQELKRQIFLGDDTFVSQMQEKIKGKNNDVNFPKAQRRSPAAISRIPKNLRQPERGDRIGLCRRGI